MSIHADPDGRLWLRSIDALHRWDGGQLDTLSFGTAQAVAMATDGQIEEAGAVSWVAMGRMRIFGWTEIRMWQNI